MSSFSKNLRDAMDMAKMTGEQIGELMDVSKSTVIHWSNGRRTPNPQQIEELASILNVPVSRLFGGGISEINTFVPLVGRASCGSPQEYDLNGYEPVPVDGRIYAPGMYAVEAEGDSMSPKINNGNIVYCNPNVQIENGNIVHYSYNDESGIKKYKMNEEGTIISLIPINPEYDIITIDEFSFGKLKMAKVVGHMDISY